MIILNAVIMGLETDSESAIFEWTEQVGSMKNRCLKGSGDLQDSLIELVVDLRSAEPEKSLLGLTKIK